MLRPDLFEAVNGTPDFYAENYSLLKYEEGQGYHALHGDAAPWTNDITRGRHISQIIYLNDVEEGGETIFPIQEATIKPRAGKCLTFPSSWSHSHNTLKAVDTKYCISIFYHQLSMCFSVSINRLRKSGLVSDRVKTS